MQLHHFFEQSCDRYPNNIALVCDGVTVSYKELDNRANQLAHYLLGQQVTSGSIVGILLERSIDCYIAILAILKVGASYVPIEEEYPVERIDYIFADLSFDLVLTSSIQRAGKKLAWPKNIALDQIQNDITTQSSVRLSPPTSSFCEDDLCYVIYTSGSTGKPKGVEITHRSIGHYVKEASTIYQMSGQDRVYQGFSLAFDASLEELWMAFANGASLIACTEKQIRSGVGLVSYLNQHHVTVFSTVPSLLATLEGQLPQLRLLILGGETCTAHLIEPWHREGLRIINTYGPTEASVVTTYADYHAGKEVTIGQPLPGYELFIVDEYLQAVTEGQEGELCIAGPAIARGYVNQPENTVEKFVGNPANPNQRWYRTGDRVYKTATGDIQFAGRLDSQIKLRGFRVELNEIETVMVQYPGVKQAVISLVSLTQPTLVAYLLLDKQCQLDLSAFKVMLRSKLPDYMIPSLIEVLDAFPLLTSGKINRQALPKPAQVRSSRPHASPQTEMERDIAKVWERALNAPNIDIDADFFYDLGGHSLHAAKIISLLRKLDSLQSISILDLYKNPTIRLLAQKFEGLHPKQRSKEETLERKKYSPPQWKYKLCALGQFFGCIFQYGVNAWQLLAVVLSYSWLGTQNAPWSLDSLLVFLGIFILMPFVSLAIAVSMKWLLLGRVKPGVYPLWGWFYFRWWLVQRLQQNIYLGRYLTGSPLISIYFRLLGAKIGKNCYIGTLDLLTPDLIRIGDHTSLGIESKCSGYIVEDGWLKIGSINIGAHCYIGARSVIGFNTLIEDNAILDDLSMLPNKECIAQGLFYSGSPALPTVIPDQHVLQNKLKLKESSWIDTVFFGGIHYLGVLFVLSVYSFSAIPSLTLVGYFFSHSNYFITMLVAIPLGSFLFLGFYYLNVILCKKIIMNRVQPGSYSLKSFYYLRHWIIDKMIDVDETFIMADSLYYPIFLRFMGAKLGEKVEMGEAPHIIPNLVTIEEGGFAASSVALGWPNVHQGIITFAEVKINKKGFIGNLSLLTAGSELGEAGLLGCLSISPGGNQAAKAATSWLGSPAVFLPQREHFTGFSDNVTYNPPRSVYLQRLMIEFCRIILPTSFALSILFNNLYLIDFLLRNYSWQTAALVLPLFDLVICLGLVAVIISLKWLILGKLKPLTKPIWDVFIWKNDLIEYSYGYFISPFCIEHLLGTPFVVWILRCLGVKAGKGIFIDSPLFSEFDLIEIGDEVSINREAIIQTHLYEDRIFKASHVTISSGCSIGVGSIVLYNTLMEKDSALGSLSLLMKSECLPANTQWAGIPAQSPGLSRRQYQTVDSLQQTEDVLGEVVLEA